MDKIIPNRNTALLLFILFAFLGAELHAQYGYGRGGYGNRGRNGRNPIPQAQTAPEAPEPKTAAQIVDEEMPGISETLELNEFEKAVMSSILKKYLQERIELQILKLPNDKLREAYESISKRQDEELKAGLPKEKYEAFLEMRKKGVAKTKKEKKKKKKKKKNSKT